MNKKVLGRVILGLLVLIVIQVIWLLNNTKKIVPVNVSMPPARQKAPKISPENKKPGPPPEKQVMPDHLLESQLLGAVLFLEDSGLKLTPGQARQAIPLIESIPKRWGTVKKIEKKLSAVLSNDQIEFLKKQNRDEYNKGITLIRVKEPGRDPLIATVIFSLEEAKKDNKKTGQEMSGTKEPFGAWADVAWGILAIQKNKKLSLTREQASKLLDLFNTLDKETPRMKADMTKFQKILNKKQMDYIRKNFGEINEMSRDMRLRVISKQLMDLLSERGK